MSDKWEKYGKIRTLYVNGVSCREIERQLHVSWQTVKKYRDGAVTPDDRLQAPRRAPIKEAVEGDILRMLTDNASLPRKQRLSAKDMREILVSEYGIAVSESHFRRIVRDIRDAGGDEFIPLEHEMCDCAQIDWLENVTAIIGGEKTLVQVLVCALPYSGAVCAFVYPDRTALSFFDGIVKALNWMAGVPRRLIFDNLLVAVFSGSGKNAVTQKGFKRIESHYAFKAEFCNRAAGWEKSNVENGVKITRKNAFIPIPRADDYAGLQKHISASLLKYNMTHKIEGRPRKIWDMFMEESAALIALPLSPYEVDETVQTKVYPDQTVRYDKIRYSVPHGHVGKSVTLRVSPFELKVYYRGNLLYAHKRERAGGKDQYILDHYLEVISRKPRAAGQSLPIKKGVMPDQCGLFLKLCPAKDAEKQLVDVMLLARDAGEERLLCALDDAINTGKPTAELVRYYLYGQQMPADEFEIKHNELSDYDGLLEENDDGEG